MFGLPPEPTYVRLVDVFCNSWLPWENFDLGSKANEIQNASGVLFFLTLSFQHISLSSVSLGMHMAVSLLPLSYA